MGGIEGLPFDSLARILEYSGWYNKTMEENNLTPPSERTTEPGDEQRRSGPSVLLWSVIVAIAFVAGLFAGYLLWQRPLQARVTDAEGKLSALQKTATVSATETAGQAAAEAQIGGQEAKDPQVEVPEQVKRYDIPLEDDPFLGSENAPITIVEFSDYQCPFCQRWHEEVFTRLQEKYGDKIRLVYRDFPLYGLHQEAELAAEAANCAGDQEKYWDYHNLLFSGQKEYSKETFIAYAEALKLKMDDFKKCMDEHRYQSEIKADYEFAAKMGVRSTPTFFVNGLAVVGAQPFEVFEQIIDLELAGKIPK